MTPTIRPATPDDAAAIADILNPLIRAGGTTALERELDAAGVADMVFDPARLIACHVALDDSGIVAGVQWLSHIDGFPNDHGDIATFARAEPKVPGVGRALFAATRQAARDAGLAAIMARIRADNTGGLAYYGKMGFVDHDRFIGVPLADGTRVDRIVKRLIP
ncbi:GNAT family N-acetyltransferase [Oceaniglobus indicus]|uniref:GNAT family N-acetyltransferase n=1 Tax=Oceaniglobus indicus TaxID=2047749 RepID=UPI000C18AB33|nr:GNAT family N-acetyltransferase [Oceaniglobus indicus]